jgi:hypothetical protein
MRFHAKYVSVGESDGEYFAVSFDNEDPSNNDFALSDAICLRCLVKFRKWLLQRESFPTSPQTGRINPDPRLEEPRMVEDRFLKRLRKKARKGLRGWPIATVVFYGPNLHQATKAAVGIVPSENAESKSYAPG